MPALLAAAPSYLKQSLDVLVPAWNSMTSGVRAAFGILVCVHAGAAVLSCQPVIEYEVRCKSRCEVHCPRSGKMLTMHQSQTVTVMIVLFTCRGPSQCCGRCRGSC